MLEAALDAVVTMDHEGRVIGWNHAAEATFGYAPSEVDRPRHGGADRAAWMRDAHRRGLARYRETAAPWRLTAGSS